MLKPPAATPPYASRAPRRFRRARSGPRHARYEHVANVDGDGYFYYCVSDAVPFPAEPPPHTECLAPPVTLDEAEVLFPAVPAVAPPGGDGDALPEHVPPPPPLCPPLADDELSITLQLRHPSWCARAAFVERERRGAETTRRRRGRRRARRRV